ncbi:MAG: CaiB/BaiF CoA transferase family protein [Alphaproteobacteria bacterium]
MTGIRVIDLSINIVGPIATQMMGDMGADVIKVESPEGDFMRAVGPSRSTGMGAFFLNINRNKRGILLNLKDLRSKEALFRLIKTADVFVHNMRPGAIKRLGLTYDEIKAVQPNIVYAWASGFGKDSDRADHPAYDDVIQGISGIPDLFRRRSGTPEYMPTMIADKLCGYALANGITTALLHRERTGEGQEVHVPMYDTMVAFNLIDHLWNGVLAEPEKGLGYQRALTPHRRPHKTKDGYIAVMASTDSQWAKMFGIIGKPELAQDARFAKSVDRVPRLAELYALVAEHLEKRTTAEWVAEFDRAQIPSGAVNTLEDLLLDPYFVKQGFFRKETHPTEGAMLSISHPTYYSKTASVYARQAPRQGQHTREILASMNFSEEEIDLLERSASGAE